MPALTANTLFHFTGHDPNEPEKGKNALLSILGTGFRPSYCAEFGDEAIGGVIKDMQIPMVCFCDLPLSKLEKHIDRYGQYGFLMGMAGPLLIGQYLGAKRSTRVSSVGWFIQFVNS